MNKVNRARLGSVCVVIIAAIALGARADAGVDKTYALSTARAATDTCDYNFAVVNGLVICVSKDGNVLRVEVDGFEHVRNGSVVEGYELCNGATKVAHDSGGFNGEAGWTDVSSTFSGSKATIVRNASGMKLKQEITRNGPDRKIIVKVTVTNTSGGTLSNWRLGRYIDADVDANITGSFSNDFVATRRGVEAFRSFASGAAGGTLKLVNQTTASVTPSLGNSSGVGLGDCKAGTAASGSTGSDGTMKLTWNIPTLTPGKTATTTFVYYAT